MERGKHVIGREREASIFINQPKQTRAEPASAHQQAARFSDLCCCTRIQGSWSSQKRGHMTGSCRPARACSPAARYADYRTCGPLDAA